MRSRNSDAVGSRGRGRERGGGRFDRNPDADVEAEAVAHAVQEGADGFFRGSVFAADAAHVPGAAGFGKAVFVHGKRLTTDGHGWTQI